MFYNPEKQSNESKEDGNNQSSLPYHDKIYNFKQKFSFVKWNLMGCFFLMISSIIQSIIYFSGHWPFGFAEMFFVILNFSTIFYSLTDFLLSLYYFRSKFKEIKTIFFRFLGIKSLGPLFICSTLLGVAKLVNITVMLIGFRYFSNVSTLEIFLLVLLMIEECFLFFSMFFHFCLEGSKTTCKILLSLSGIFLIAICFFLIYSSEKVVQIYSKESELNAKIINYAFKGISRISMIFIIVIEIIFFISLRKFKILIFAGANATLLLTIIMVMMNGFLIKNLNQINNFMKDKNNCVIALKNLNQQFLSTMMCSDKYLETEQSPYLSCDLQEQSFIWENPTNWTKNACINTDCCDKTLTLIYYSDIMIIYLQSLGIIFFGFVIIACCYYIGSMYENIEVEYKLSSFFHKFIIFMYILIPILGIIALSTVPFILPEKLVLFPIVGEVNISNVIQYPSNATDYIPSCFLLSSYLSKTFDPQLSLTKCSNIITINSTSSCVDDIRVILMIENADIYVPLDFNNQYVKIYDKRSKILIFSQENLQTEFDYLAFEGPVEYIKSFVTETIKICPFSLFGTIKYSYTIFQIEVSSFQISPTLYLSPTSYFSNIVNHHESTTNSTSNSNALNTNSDIAVINFNLTDNSSFQVIGKIVDIFDLGLENCSVCFTEQNPELGKSYECFQGTSSDDEGFFSLNLNNLMNQVTFAGYLQFLKQGLYPLQIELTFDSNEENILNIGFIKMMPLNSSQNSSSSSSSDSTTTQEEDSTSSSSQSSLIYTQLELDNINFGNLTLNVLDMLTLEELDSVMILLYSSSTECESNLEESPLGRYYIENSGTINFYNLEYNTYTFFISKYKYKTNCVDITINSDEKTEIVLISPQLQPTQVRILLQWESSNITLGLFAMYKFENDSEKCVLSYQNTNCTGMNLIIHDSKTLNGKNAQILTIDYWQNLTYLIYLKEIISQDSYNQKNQSNETLNFYFLYYSNFLMRYYVEELELPAEYLNGVTVDQNIDLNNLLKEENLAYLLACIKGGSSDIANVPTNPYWIGSFYQNKGENQYPETDVCIF